MLRKSNATDKTRRRGTRLAVAGAAGGLVLAALCGTAGAYADDASPAPINPNNIHNPSVEVSSPSTGAAPGGIHTEAAQGNEAGILSDEATKNVATHSGSFRVSFSSGYNFNSLDTQVVVSGSSQNWWTGTPTPAKITLADTVSSRGLGVGVSVPPAVGISTTSSSVKWSTSASNHKTIEHEWDNWKLNGLLTGVSEQATGTVTFGSTSYSTTAG